MNNINIDSTSATEKKQINSKTEKTEVFTNSVKILVVEDVEINMLFVEALLKEYMPNCNIFKATNGEMAIEFAIEELPDIILMDIQMPILDGIEATKLLRNIESTKNIPIIALSAGVIKEEIDKCMAAGMNDFVGKPVQKEELLDKIKKHIKTNLPDSKAINISDLKHFNIDTFLERINYNDELSKLLISTSVPLFERQIASLHKYSTVDNSNKEDFAREIHSLKGASANLSLEILQSLCIEIETKINNTEKFVLADYLEKLHNEWLIVRKLLLQN